MYTALVQEEYSNWRQIWIGSNVQSMGLEIWCWIWNYQITIFWNIDKRDGIGIQNYENDKQNRSMMIIFLRGEIPNIMKKKIMIYSIMIYLKVNLQY
jgi:hypothetical protein